MPVADPQPFEGHRKDFVMLMRFEPFREFDRITEELLSRTPSAPDPGRRLPSGRRVQDRSRPARRGSRFIDVTVEKDVLTVRATRAWVPAEDDEIQMAERAQGDFSRQLFLGESLDRDHIAAIYDDGVLTLTIPVAEEAKPRKVEITHAEDEVPAVTAAIAK